MNKVESSERRDWVSGAVSYTIAWGGPSAVMIAAVWAAPGLRAVVWAAMLVWMGTACLVNAGRCGRVHCRFTGPFFLVMAVVVALHGLGAIPLGPLGWAWIGIAIALGTAAIWILSERLLGRYRVGRYRGGAGAG